MPAGEAEPAPAIGPFDCPRYGLLAGARKIGAEDRLKPGVVGSKAQAEIELFSDPKRLDAAENRMRGCGRQHGCIKVFDVSGPAFGRRAALVVEVPANPLEELIARAGIGNKDRPVDRDEPAAAAQFFFED